MDKSEDFPECTPDQRAVLWTLLELKQSERELAAAASRIAQQSGEIRGLKEQLEISRHLVHALNITKRTAEAALTRALEVIEPFVTRTKSYSLKDWQAAAQFYQEHSPTSSDRSSRS